jgi:hypothetical protein
MAVASQSLTLKIDMQGEVRRLREWPGVGTEPSVEIMRSAISSLFDLNPEQEKALRIQYQDDEGDRCTLIDASLSDALTLASTSGVLRLWADCSKSCLESTSVASSQSGLQAMEPTKSMDSSCQFFRIESSGEFAIPESNSPSEVGSEIGSEIGEPVDDLPDTAESSQQNEETVEVVPDCYADTSLSSDLQSEGEVVDELPDCYTDTTASLPSESDASAQSEPEVEQSAAETPQRVSGFNDIAQMIQENAPEVTEACHIAKERLESAQPHLKSGVAYLSQQARDDLGSAFQDVQNITETKAFATAAAKVGGVMVAAGLARRAPAAAVIGVAAAMGLEATTRDDNDDAPADDASECRHFRRQVKNDFHAIRKDVNAALNCMLGQESTEESTSASGDSQASNPRPRKTLKTEIPAVASSLVGVAVAAWLLPFRAARCAAANVAKLEPQTSGTDCAASSEHPDEAPAVPESLAMLRRAAHRAEQTCGDAA